MSCERMLDNDSAETCLDVGRGQTHDVMCDGCLSDLELVSQVDAFARSRRLQAELEEERKQHDGAVRKLEGHRAELVKVSANAAHWKELAEKHADSLLLRVEPNRRRLPSERPSCTHAFAIHYSVDDKPARLKGFVTTGFYDDGSVGEVFIKLDQQGTTVSGFCDAFSIAVSMLLQTGTPLDAICRKFKFMKFEPAGRTETPGIRKADSVIDYVVSYLERRYVARLALADEAPAGG